MTPANESKGDDGTTGQASETVSQATEVKSPLEPSAQPLSSPSLDERRFLFEKEMALCEKSLKNRELDLKETELKKTVWRDPVFLGISAAALSVLGSLLVTTLSNHNAQVLAKQKTNADIVTELIRNVDAATAKRNLQVAISVGLVQDPDTKIADSLKKGVFLSLPPVAQTQSTSQAAGNVPNTSQTIATIQTSEQLIADQSIVVPNGGYALTSSPTCPNQQLEDTVGIASAMSRDVLGQSYPGLQSLTPTAAKPSVLILQSSGSRGDAASCGVVAFELPSEYKSLRAEFSAGEKDGALLPCLQQLGPSSLNCDVGWAAWTWSISDSKAVATFKNWSGDRTRQARVRLIGIGIRGK